MTYSMPTFKGLPVPWVARRAGEEPDRKPWEGVQIERYFDVLSGTYKERLLCDAWYRDHLGWLWQPSPQNLGGEPQFAQINGERHRRCMDELLCQVCGGSAVVDGESSWLGPEVIVRLTQARDSSRPLENNHPPVCVSCVEMSLEKCPHLRGVGYVHLLVGRVEPEGVIADIYDYTGDIVRQGIIYAHDADAGMALARQRVVMLHDWRIA